MKKVVTYASALFACALFCAGVEEARSEAMLQYFNTDWNEIAQKMPELAEAGYDSLWLPPPTKGSGGLSVGYDLWDRFDLGSKDQRGFDPHPLRDGGGTAPADRDRASFRDSDLSRQRDESQRV